MEKKVFENRFIRLSFHEESKVIKFIWENTLGLMEADFKEVCQIQTEYVERCAAKSILIDNTNFGFPIDPELQEWVNDNCLEKWLHLNIRKIAITTTREIIAQLSVEQIWEEPIGQKFNVRFFDTANEAEAWLK
ncbi:hypothetical protein [uncultured Microscilla sp.]|uniref:hypothetical protein n=1 Tax=uncultured Microscilla sp. TaxID=432653 RepID=UPI002632E414|nr:hypothetical protein [uncultured Microscilla sp.]